MKKTKELESEETSVSMDKILKIESLEDAKEFERVASGRKFAKKVREFKTYVKKKLKITYAEPEEIYY